MRIKQAYSQGERIQILSSQQPFLELLRKESLGGWRDGSEIKSIACSPKGPEFNSQQPHGGSQPSVMRSGALFWPAGIHAERILYT